MRETYSDEELLDLMRLGEQSAFSSLYHRYWATMFNNAYKRLKNRDLSQDVVQNVFADLWERRAVVEIANLPAYLHTAVRFQVLKQLALDESRIAMIDVFESELTSNQRTDDDLRENQIKELLRIWIAALPEKRREIFLQHYFHGKTTEQIAIELNISQKTVQNQLTTATSIIKNHFDRILLIEMLSNYMLSQV